MISMGIILPVTVRAGNHFAVYQVCTRALAAAILAKEQHLSGVEATLAAVIVLPIVHKGVCNTSNYNSAIFKPLWKGNF